jgi:type IX secretion system PorP/SprF family membrane protein
MIKSLLIVCFLASGIFLRAQDPHFSQYYASQLTVNPASTGMFSGDLKVSGLYRQQWPQFGSPFVTGTVSMEFKPGRFRDGVNINRLAFGGLLMFDKTPDGVLKSQYAYASVAYHKALDAEGHNRLGIGFMGGYNQRMLDASQLSFGNQFESGGFNTARGSESFSSNRLSSFDLHTGILFSHEEEDRLYYFGASAYHLLGPKNYYLGTNDVLSTIPKRLNLNAGLNIKGQSLNYAASVLVMRQQKVDEITLGGAVGVPVGESGVLYGGAWYRVNESIIPTINLQWKTINAGLSYDTFVDTKKTMSKPKSFELSLSYRLAPFHDFKTGCFAF